MPTDKHGILHTGSIGLFDDDDEYNVIVEQSERHEREHLESQIRRHERREACQQRRKDRAAGRKAKGKSKLPSPLLWLGKAFVSARI
jgi:hypothetical protein